MNSYGPSQELDKLDPRHFVIVQGARVNNLKNLSVAIPRNQLVVITGLSGSGKSSLAFDTIFAEGLHVHDISKLLTAINNLIQVGNSVLIIEHTVELIKCADWIIDLGPEGGEKGGKIVFSGTPEDMIKLQNNYTAKYLRNKLI